MKVLMLTGSPHKTGTSALLADEFEAGAKGAGHELLRLDVAANCVCPCLGCDHCRKDETAGVCVHKDIMTDNYPALIEADAVVLVTPLYYFGMSAQLKAAVDRFYAVNTKLLEKSKKLYLLASCADYEQSGAMDSLAMHFRAISRYLGWSYSGMLLATDCGSRSDIENSEFPQRARELGAKL